MSRNLLFVIAATLTLGGGCTNGSFPDREPTVSERAGIEAAVRACGLPVRDARWSWGGEQWAFTFTTDEFVMRGQPNATTTCVSSVSEKSRLQGLDISIGYTP